MKTSGREFYYSVSGLMVPKYMVNDNLDRYIDNFIELVPKNTDEFEKFVRYELSMEKFVEEMEKLYIMLCDIHAHWLEVEAARILRLTEVNEGELCRTLLTPFITNLRTLAIDIQMSQNRGYDINYHMRSEKERYKDVVSSIGVVIALLQDEDYRKAYDIATNINELQDNNNYKPLISHISNKKKAEALELAARICDIYKQKIEDVNQITKTNVKKKIIVVDDMPDVLTVVSSMLKDHYQVLPFKDGGDALRAIETTHQPDAFLLDVDMPKMSGFLLAEKIRQHPIYKETPILFLTANSTRENLIKSAQYNPKSFIVKPVNKDIIIARLNGCLEIYADGQMH